MFSCRTKQGHKTEVLQHVNMKHFSRSLTDQPVYMCFQNYMDLKAKDGKILMQNTSMISFDGGSASKVDDVTALPSRHKMADMRYYGNVMTTTRWRICVTMATL